MGRDEVKTTKVLTRCPACARVLKKRGKPEEEVAGDGITKRPKPDEKEMVEDAGSKEDGSKSMAQPAGGEKRRTKFVTRRMSPILRELVLNRPPRPPLESFDHHLDEDMAARHKELMDFDAYLVDQYRTKGYAEIQEEVTDGDDDELVRCTSCSGWVLKKRAKPEDVTGDGITKHPMPNPDEGGASRSTAGDGAMESGEVMPTQDLVRCRTCSGWVLKKLAKPEEVAVDDAAMGRVGITKRSKRTKKVKGTKDVLSPEPEEVMVADAGSKEKRTKKVRAY